MPASVVEEDAHPFLQPRQGLLTCQQLLYRAKDSMAKHREWSLALHPVSQPVTVHLRELELRHPHHRTAQVDSARAICRRIPAI